jgi:hypothetical protein
MDWSWLETPITVAIVLVFILLWGKEIEFSKKTETKTEMRVNAVQTFKSRSLHEDNEIVFRTV